MSWCPYCLAGNTSVEIAGLRFHTLSDRWISCNPVKEQREVSTAVRGELIGRVQTMYQFIIERTISLLSGERSGADFPVRRTSAQ